MQSRYILLPSLILERVQSVACLSENSRAQFANEIKMLNIGHAPILFNTYSLNFIVVDRLVRQRILLAIDSIVWKIRHFYNSSILTRGKSHTCDYVYSYIWYGIYVLCCSRIDIRGTRQFIQFLSRYASVMVHDSNQTYSNVREYVIILIQRG